MPAKTSHTPDLEADLRDLRQCIDYLARQKSATASRLATAGAGALSRLSAAPDILAAFEALTIAVQLSSDSLLKRGPVVQRALNVIRRAKGCTP